MGAKFAIEFVVAQYKHRRKIYRIRQNINQLRPSGSWSQSQRVEEGLGENKRIPRKKTAYWTSTFRRHPYRFSVEVASEWVRFQDPVFQFSSVGVSFVWLELRVFDILSFFEIIFGSFGNICHKKICTYRKIIISFKAILFLMFDCYFVKGWTLFSSRSFKTITEQITLFYRTIWKCLFGWHTRRINTLQCFSRW